GPVLGLHLIPVLLVTEDEGGGSAETDLVGRVARQVPHQRDGVFVGGGIGAGRVGAVPAHHAVVDETVLGGDLAGGQPGGSGGNGGRFEDDNLQPGSLQQHGGRQAGDPRSGDDHVGGDVAGQRGELRCNDAGKPDRTSFGHNGSSPSANIGNRSRHGPLPEWSPGLRAPVRRARYVAGRSEAKGTR